MNLLKRISFRTDKKEEWLAFCQRNGINPSDALRQVIEKLINGKTSYHQIMEVPKALTDEPASKTERHRVEIGLNTKEYELVREHAKRTGFSPSRWIVILIRHQFLKASPPLAISEIDGIDSIVYELRMIGRNLNQIARQLNSHELHSSQVELLPLIEGLQQSLDKEKKQLSTLLNQNIDRW